MSHKFRFTKDSRDRLKDFASSETPRKEKRRKPKPKPQVNAVHLYKQLAREKARRKDQPAPEPVAPVQSDVAPDDKDIAVVLRTHIGMVRKSNQDALIASPEDRLWGVADGMGGHNGGETASSSARDGLIAELRGAAPDQGTLRTAICTVNRQVFQHQREDESLAGMGTTMTVLWFSDACLYIGHVGDSRAYRLRDGELKQITDDHSLVAEMVRSGMITSEQASVHPMRNVITRAVGTDESVEVDLICADRCKGDKWLVCSDGLYGMVDDDVMAEILREHPMKEAAELLMEAALDNGGRDNISLVILEDKEAQA